MKTISRGILFSGAITWCNQYYRINDKILDGEVLKM